VERFQTLVSGATRGDSPFRIFHEHHQTVKRDVSESGPRHRVLLFDMPFRRIFTGNLGLSTLKPILEDAGIPTDVRYLSVEFAKSVGLDLYDYLANLSVLGMSGEIIFTPHFYALPVKEFIRENLRPYLRGTPTPPVSTRIFQRPEDIERFWVDCEDVCESRTPGFLDSVIKETMWSEYDILGFSLVFEQTLASLALAKRIKEKWPEKTIIFGGPNCDGEMGLEILKRFACVDIVSIGEADLSVVPMIEGVRTGMPLEEVPGIAFRSGGAVVRSGAAPLLEDLDSLPIPNFEDYFEAIKGLGVRPLLYFETSRGCWWGQKHLCSFCGLNANGLTYRRKSPERCIREITGQSAKYHCKSLAASDNILDMGFFKNVFPALKEWRALQPVEQRIDLFYEMKSNIKKEQLRLAKEAGLKEAQPGIESFSDHVLQLMDKGTTGIQQMQFIKWATELGIRVVYGILYNNPGETAEDYEEMFNAVDFLAHLSPPSYVTDISVDRFSPYFKDPERYGIKNVRPHPYYSKIFPQGDVDLTQIAYHFTFDHAGNQDPRLGEATKRCLGRVGKWARTYRPSTLVYDIVDEGIWVLDRRGERNVLAQLTGVQAEIFRYCDGYHSLDNIQSQFAFAGGEQVQQIVEKLVALKWMWKDAKGHCLALPIRRDLQAVVAAHSRQMAAAPPRAYTHPQNPGQPGQGGSSPRLE
jgi:ribosomal peptide maturation radical SAM protein 1